MNPLVSALNGHFVVSIRRSGILLGHYFVLRGMNMLSFGYAGNPNNNNGWIKADVPLLGELRIVVDGPMVGPIVDEIAKPIVEAEAQMIAPVVDMDEDIAMLFGDDDFEDDASEGFDEEEVWEVNKNC
ncbi:hypothetical protein Tco_0070956 [Tanacetum coccineum]